MTINTKSQTSQSEILANPQMGDVVNIGGKEYEYINHDVWREKANTIVRAQNENGDFENLNADSFIGQAHLTGEEIQEGFITTNVLQEVSKMKIEDQTKEIQKDTHKNTINALDGKIEMYTKEIAEDEKRQMEIELDVMNHLDSDLGKNEEELATLKKDESKLKGNIKKLQKSPEGQEQSLTKSLEKNWNEVLRLRKQIEGVKNGKGKDNFSQKQIDEKQKQIDTLIEERKKKKQKLNPQKNLLKEKQQELKKNQEKQSFQKAIIKQVQEKITKKQQEHTILQKKILEKSMSRLQISIKTIEIESQKIQAFLSMRTEGIGSPISEVETKGIEATLATMQEAKTKLEQELPVYQEKINAIDTKIVGFDKTYFELVNVTSSENEQQGGMPIVYEGDKSNDIPVNPENPENSETPEVPTDPEKPETPEVPTDPEKPETPEVPTDPEKPETPEVPTDPEDSEDSENTETPEDTEVSVDSTSSEDTEVSTDPEAPEVPTDPENSENTDTSNETTDEIDEVVPFKPVPNPMAEYDIPESMTMKATLANMDEYIRDRAREQAEEQMRELYNKAGLLRPFFFFTRNGKTNKLQQQFENEILENMKAEMAASFAERVGRENALKNQKANNTIEGDNHIDDVVDRYVKNKISDDELGEELQVYFDDEKTQASDVFRQAKNIQEYKKILSHLFDNPDSLSEAMQKLRSNPYLSEMVSQATGIDIHNNTEEIEKYLASGSTLAKLIHQKITVSIDVFDTAKGAYNISAEDKNTTGYKMGKWLQKRPYTSMFVSSGTLAGLSAIGGGLLNALGGGSLVGGVSGLRRNADMTDEHRGFETRIAHNKQQIQELRAQISDLENNLQNTTGWNNKRKLKKEIKQLQKVLSGFERDEQVFGKNTYEVGKKTYSQAEYEATHANHKELLEAYFEARQKDMDIYNSLSETEKEKFLKRYGQGGAIPRMTAIPFDVNGNRVLDIETDESGNTIGIKVESRKIIANATQRHFAPIERINNKLTTYFEKENLSEKDQEYYIGWLSQALARLDAGMQTGHNFLYSASGGEGEEDLDILYRSVDSGIKKLGIDLGQIRNNPKYLRTVNQFIDDYEHAHNGFMNKRAKSARNTGIVSGALYGVSSTLVQAITGSGFFESKAGSTVASGTVVPNTSVAPSSLAHTVSTPSYAIDAGIADKLQQTLGANYDTFVNELTQHTTPEEFWSILNEKVFQDVGVATETKNEIMTYILNATDVVNGKEIPELVTEAMKNNVLDPASFQTTLDRLAQWGYKNVDANWLQESIQGLSDGSKVIADFSSEQQTIISEACFDAVHRDGIVGDTSPLYRVFMDTITETVPTTDTIVVPEGDIVPVSESVQKTTANWWGSLGIPTWRNTFLAWAKMKPSQRGETPTDNNPPTDNPPQNSESSNETEGDVKNNAEKLQELLKNDKEYLVELLGTLSVPLQVKKDLNKEIEERYNEKRFGEGKNVADNKYQKFDEKLKQIRKGFIIQISEVYNVFLEDDTALSREGKKEAVKKWIKEVEKNKEQNLDSHEDLQKRFGDILNDEKGETKESDGESLVQKNAHLLLYKGQTFDFLETEQQEKVLRYSKQLESIRKIYGTERLEHIVASIREKFNYLTRDFETISEYGKQDMWIYWDIAKAEYYRNNPGKSGIQYTIESAFDSDEQQKNILYRQIGREYMEHNDGRRELEKGADEYISSKEYEEIGRTVIEELEQGTNDHVIATLGHGTINAFKDVLKKGGGLAGKIPGKEKLQNAVETGKSAVEKGKNTLDSAKEKVRDVGSAVKSKVGMTKDEALNTLDNVKRQSLSALKSDANLDADVSVNTIIANALESNSIKEIKNAFSRLSEEQKKTEEAQKVQSILDDTLAGDKMKLDFLRDYNQEFSEKIAKARGSRENIQEEIISAPLQNTDNAPQKGNSIIDAMQAGEGKTEKQEETGNKEFESWKQSLPHFLRNADDENIQLLFEVTQKEGEKVKEIMNKLAQLETSKGSEKEVVDGLWNIGQDLASIFGSIPKEDKVAMMKTLADAWNEAQNTSNRENPLYIEVPKIDDLVSEIQEFVIGDGIAKVNNISSWAVWKHGDARKEVLQFAHVS